MLLFSRYYNSFVSRVLIYNVDVQIHYVYPISVCLVWHGICQTVCADAVAC